MYAKSLGKDEGITLDSINISNLGNYRNNTNRNNIQKNDLYTY
jgi:hypothetical protein